MSNKEMDKKIIEVIDEVKEMMFYVINSNSYVKGKLKEKEVGSEFDRKDIESDIENCKNEVSKRILMEELENIDEKRGKELVKRYGRLLLNDKLLKKLNG